MNLTKDEQDILDSVERGEWQRIPDFENQAARYREAAKATLRQNKLVHIRISERDLIRLQKTAMREGLPYQGIISSVLHKFINGRLVERPENFPDGFTSPCTREP